ncbi:biotin-dependent carboxyltransferase family protein [Dokdonella sp.]|uniref:5-oxoprolinase subunit C family protein n=1 Tax=Dokdonella sp. TaxID=2291710 RepID=UPI0025B8EA59|nr:biotin-dependent carboxyltransferase family protein [Dokdonella sp.]MBX3692610.1 biotin-dependent carboxyltransferase family protein [Dokdonella sp.]
MSLRIVKPGLLTSVQDLGRHGHAALGVGHAGAIDMPALVIANALVGNVPSAPILEMNLVGPVLEFERAVRIALCGAEVDARLDGECLDGWRGIDVVAGQVLDCRRFARGARACLAVRGGFAVTRVLGSASADLNAGLGPPALAVGDVLAFGDASRASTMPPRGVPFSVDPRPWFDVDTRRPLRLVRGHHFDALDVDSRAALFGATFHIGRDSNRVGLRLEGVPLRLAHPLELVSEAVADGTLQLPPGGQPIMLLAERPTTGGYPRIGQLAAADFTRLAQRRPGDEVRFVEAGLDEAIDAARRQRLRLERLLTAIRER